MPEPVTHRVAHLVLWAAAAVGAGLYIVRVLVGGVERTSGDSALLGAVFVLLAAAGAVRAVRGGRRHGDLLFAAGLASSALGWLYWSVLLVPLADPPYPSPADALWIGLFPLAYISLAWQVGRHPAARRALALDILIGSAGVTAAVAGLVVPVLAAGRDLTTVGVNAVYLGANVAHVLVLLSVLAMRGFDAPPALWRRLAAAVILAVTNAQFLVDVASTGRIPLDTWLNLAWLAAFALMVSSVDLHEPADRPSVPRWSLLVVPLSGTGLALLVLLATPQGSSVARWIAAGAVVLALGRMALAFVEAEALAVSHRLAHTDELTGLVNRRGFYDAMRRTLAADATATLVLLDLNRFKEVNDTLGHQAGDTLLALVARRLAAETRSGDRGNDLVARVGGDEFVLLLRRSTPLDGELAARRLLAALAGVYDVGGLSVRSSASAGLVHLPEHGVEPDELVRRADVAMYAAKAAGEPVLVYHEGLDTRSVADLARLERVRAALAEGRLLLHYQPKVDLRSGAIVGVEALARIRDEDGTLLRPGEFLAALEHAGQLVTLTAQVLDLAIAQAAAWRAGGTPLTVAVNVPAAALVQADFGERVRDALLRHDLPGRLLFVEVTEESLLHDRDAGRAALEAVRALGARVSVDDYGTGWSSLTYLRELPLDELKLDRTFVRGMANDRRTTRIVHSTVALAHGLDLDVVAEGVETSEDRDAAAAAGCDLAQGYWFAMPVPPEQIAELLPPAAVTVDGATGPG